MSASNERILRLSLQLTEALSAARTQAEVARAIFEHGFAMTGADAGVLVMPAPGSPDLLQVVDHTGFSDGAIEAWQQFPVALIAPLSDAFRSGVPVYLGSCDEAIVRYPDWPVARERPVPCSWVALPLIAHDDVVGALGFTYEHAHEFSREERLIFRALAQRCAQALDRARLSDEVRRREAALRKSEERLALALDAGRIGTWELDPIRLEGEPSPLCRELVGFAGSGPVSVGDFMAVVHAEDRDRVEAQLARALDSHSDGTYRTEFRVRLPDGSERWISASGLVRFTNEAGVRRAVQMMGTLIDVTAQKQAEETLRRSNQRKTEFLAVLSHELRNPLAAVRNSVHLLDCAHPESDAARRAHEVIRRQTEHLSHLVDDLLDVSRIDHGKIELQPETCDAREIVRRTCDDARAQYQLRGVQLEYSQSSEPVRVYADPARLVQMVGNLLHNAAKFTNPGGHVEVSVWHDGRECEIRVADSGVGISREELARIFDRFAQAERTRSGDHGGLGIGLSLVQSLATLHGGRVRAESAGPGRGAEFTIHLPLSSLPLHVRHDRAFEPAPVRLSVLLIEDNEDAGVSLCDLLEIEGHSTRLAATATAGLEAACMEPPDVIICDVGLPDFSGYELIKRARARGISSRAIALTGYAQAEDRRRALEAGFDAHLSKPPPIEELRRMLSETAADRKSAPAVVETAHADVL